MTRMFVSKLLSRRRIGKELLVDDSLSIEQGEEMKKYGLRMATAVFGLALFGAGAKAQDRDQLIVNIPFPFVAAGKTLPAGTYHLSRVSSSNVNELILRGVENHDGVFVLSTEWEDARVVKPGVT